ncbi:MAG: hypothetical protein KDN20_14405 [Verrucomicrobiae bacterium]|nr:hypothetical protein [Verrucomicrobiae bacterium]
MDVPEIIICVDCGQKAHRITQAPEDGWEVGDFVAYRCSGCFDRWDLVVEDSDLDESRGESRFDFRQWLSDREDEKSS